MRKYPYIVAEIGGNHNGDVELGKKMIKAAKDAEINATSKLTANALNTKVEGKTELTLDGVTINMGSTTTTLMDLKSFGICNISAKTVNFN